MDEITLAILAFTFSFAVYILVNCYRKVMRASRHYSRAKRVLDDVVLSFRNDLEALDKRVREVEAGARSISAKSQQEVDRIGSEVASVASRLERLSDEHRKVRDEYSALKDEVGSLTNLRNKGGEGSLLRGDVETPEIPPPSAVPIRRERALAPLTQTELIILELLAVEGEKTAPQIRGRISLSREHTARLMKRLYLRGYVDRRIDRMPYGYRVKKEMQNILDVGPASRSKNGKAPD